MEGVGVRGEGDRYDLKSVIGRRQRGNQTRDLCPGGEEIAPQGSVGQLEGVVLGEKQPVLGEKQTVVEAGFRDLCLRCNQLGAHALERRSRVGDERVLLIEEHSLAPCLPARGARLRPDHIRLGGEIRERSQ